jgi:ribosomal protein S18 acetylase RimI-like enzyme
MYEPGIVIREAREEDIKKIAPMVIRFYRFNEEFDPAWSTKDLSLDDVEKILKERLAAGDIILFAEVEDKAVGFLRAEINENPFLEKGRIVVVKELYVKPEFRRRGIAKRLINEVESLLRKYDAKMLAAELPALNVIANAFYKNLGFRNYLSVYIKEV